MPFDITNLVESEDTSCEPGDKRDESDQGCEDKPEPDENKDFLVEQVDREDALDGVSVNVSQLSNLKIAQRHPGEPFTDSPVLLLYHLVEYLDTINMVIRAQEGI